MHGPTTNKDMHGLPVLNMTHVKTKWAHYATSAVQSAADPRTLNSADHSADHTQLLVLRLRPAVDLEEPLVDARLHSAQVGK